jgi:hypothetical protein
VRGWGERRGEGPAQVELGCPKCGRAIEIEAPGTKPCRHCGAETTLRAPPETPLCLACGCPELYRHRDFNQRLGLALVATGALLWLVLGSFWPMVAAAAIDVLLYFTLPDVAICYRCRAHHRGFFWTSTVPRFDLERHEHYRFEKARAEGRLPPRPPTGNRGTEQGS